MAHPRFRILALDVDGTLLDADGRLRPRTAAAVAQAEEAGIRPVLCTGRRYRRARPVAGLLNLDAPIVCNSGAIVKQPGDHATLWRADLASDIVAELLDLFARSGHHSVCFVDRTPDEHDFVASAYPTGHADFDDYVGQNLAHARLSPCWPTAARDDPSSDLDGPHFHICAIGSRTEMQAVEAAVLGRLRGRVRTFVQRSPRYLGTMCEVIRRDASKWSALLHLAELWDIDPAEICAVGDDFNDLPMILGAGLGVAMGHAPQPVLAAADLVTGDHHQDGVAMLIENILLGS